MKQRMKDAGYTYMFYMDGHHILKDNKTGVLEIWFANKGHASYGIVYKNTELEYARQYHPEKESFQL